MPRPPGRRNNDFDSSRQELLAKILRWARLRQSGMRFSFLELARAAGVSVPTLRHYFRSRAGLLRELIASLSPYQYATGSLVPVGPAADQVAWLLGELVAEWRGGYGEAYALGSRLALLEPGLGPTFVSAVIDPLLGRAEEVIGSLMNRSDLARGDERGAAMALLAPILLELSFHEAGGGVTHDDRDIDAMCTEHVQRFLRAYAPRRGPRIAP
jgi:AcrR family transcriptional regulator